MKVGIIQSNYIPWRGYFDFIRECDVFVIHDDIQYTKGDWRNRNKIKTPQGAKWMTVPVHYNHTAQLICETRIDYSTNWRAAHQNMFEDNYRTAPFWDIASTLLAGWNTQDWVTISDVNRALIRHVCGFLEIQTPLLESRTFKLDPALRKTERIITICKALGVTTYLSGPAAKVYLDGELLRRNGIVLEYKTYNYPEYPQLHGRFESNLSVLDLIANTGPDAPYYIWRKP